MTYKEEVIKLAKLIKNTPFKCYDTRCAIPGISCKECCEARAILEVGYKQVKESD